MTGGEGDERGEEERGEAQSEDGFHKKFSNDEARMTKAEGMTNDEASRGRRPRPSAFGFPSDFVIRASSFQPQADYGSRPRFVSLLSTSSFLKVIMANFFPSS